MDFIYGYEVFNMMIEFGEQYMYILLEVVIKVCFGERV